ncbi:M3 family peptidase [Nakamurella sp. YIM 132087]|uniref:M3 family peptidase n=1 Tax=Nakamurella alba TaxID=2665158 RepID=A0A7K1FS48_9ACTN|nr:M3 family metallopeptidase [Nakamurella alba]MTD16063.1 M3 family peptidase [Nakamurella alba]
MTDNPLLHESTLPFGLPPFAQIRTEHFGPALDAGMAEHLAEIAAITADPAPATFANTVEALERSGRTLERAGAVFGNLISSVAGPDLQAVEAAYAPELAAHSDALYLDRALFERISRVHEARLDSGLDPEQIFLVERYHRDFRLAGAELDDAGQTELRELNRRISELTTRFRQQLQSSMEERALLLDDASELDGLEPAQIAAAAAAASADGHPGKYLIRLILPSGQPALSALRDRSVRERLHRASVERAPENGDLAVEIARLRARRARLLGFEHHAALTMATQTARTVDAVDGMLEQVVAPAMANAARERVALQELADVDGVQLAPWDWAYYAERVRAARYDLDTAALRPYFELDRVLSDGVFHAATEVYGVTFHLREDLQGYHPDVRVWEVRDADGTPIGLYLGDYLARIGKRGGAWMNSFVDQSRLLGKSPVVVNNLNVPAPAAGGPALLTLDEVSTLFHEFGHALHGLFSTVAYPRFSGTSVPRDFVEFPSQVNEMWAMWPEVLLHYAVHVETGEPLPADVVAAIDAAQLWGQGFGTVEYLAATVLDQAWHRVTPETDIPSAAEFEAEALEKAGLASDLIPPRYRTAYFQHIFAGGYAAGYYSYLWAEVLDADTVEWFKEHGGMRRENGDLFRAELLSVGGSRDAMDSFRAVRGRDADIAPLLRRRGLVPSA